MSHQNDDQSRAEKRTITPAVAKELLASNTHNRGIAEMKIAVYALAMKRGEWDLNGEAIKIADDGTILDGQHRLLAVVESGVTIRTWVITGLAKSTQETMDTGKSRRLSDVLKLRGEDNYIPLSAILVGIIRTEQWGFKAGIGSGGARAYVVTNAQATQRLDADPFIRDIPGIISQASRRSYITKKTIGTLYYFFCQIDRDDADDFILKLGVSEKDFLGSDGTSLFSEDDPILALRSVLKSLHDDTKGERNQAYVTALVIKAWNKYRNGEPAKQLRFRVGGHNPETFPLPE